MIRDLILLQFTFLLVTILIPTEAFAHLEKEGGGGEEAPILSRSTEGTIQLTTDTQSDQWRQSFVNDIHSLWGHEVSVRTLNNGTHIFFLLTWSDPSMAKEKDLKEKTDGAAIIFESTRAGQQMDQTGLSQNQSLMENKKSNETAVKEVKDIWYWSAGTAIGPEQQLAASLSLKRGIIIKAQWNKDNWAVIIGRQIQPKNGDENTVSFLPGIREVAFVKFLVWDGFKGESFTAENDEALAHYDFILLPHIDVYPKDVYIWSGVIAAGALVFLFVDQKLYRNQQARTTHKEKV